MRTNFSCRTLQAHLNQQKFKLSFSPKKAFWKGTQFCHCSELARINHRINWCAFCWFLWYIFHVCVGFSDQGGSADGDGENVFVGGWGVQDEAAPGGVGPGQTQSGEVEENRDGHRHQHGPDLKGGSEGIQGDPHLSFLQSQAKGRSPHQMLPLFLLRLPQDKVRIPS